MPQEQLEHNIFCPVPSKYFGEIALKPQSTVLIVDQSSETSEVLKTLLERQGRIALSAKRPDLAIQAVEQSSPDLILLDLDDQTGCQTNALSQLKESASLKNTPIVVIGSTKKHKAQLPDGQFISKPYQYRDLLRKIDQVMGDAA